MLAFISGAVGAQPDIYIQHDGGEIDRHVGQSYFLDWFRQRSLRASQPLGEVPEMRLCAELLGCENSTVSAHYGHLSAIRRPSHALGCLTGRRMHRQSGKCRVEFALHTGAGTFDGRSPAISHRMSAMRRSEVVASAV